MAEWGHVQISREDYAEDPWWNEPRVFSKWEALEDCRQMAAWRGWTRVIGQHTERLERGEFIASVRFLATRWRWGKHVVERFLEAAKKRGHLQRQREGQGGTIYLVVNYGSKRSTSPDKGTLNGTDEGTPRGHLGDKEEEGKEGKEGKKKREMSLSPDEQAVVEHYRLRHPKRLRGEIPERTLRLLRQALKGYSVDDLKQAIDGNAGNPWNQQNNFMDLALILRDAEHIDRYIALAEQRPASNGRGDVEELDEYERVARKLEAEERSHAR